MAFLSSNNAYDISVFEDENLENQDLHKKNKVVKIPKKKFLGIFMLLHNCFLQLLWQ